MSAGKLKSILGKFLWLALRIYAGLCVLGVTGYLGVLLWNNLFSASSGRVSATTVMATFGDYMAREYPKRSGRFFGLADTLALRTKDTPVSSADLIMYLGKPDYIQGTTEAGTLAWLYDRAPDTNKWALLAFLQNGKLSQIASNDSKVVSYSSYKPYAAP